MVIQARPSSSRKDIFERELEAMVHGQIELLQEAGTGVSYRWRSDNAGAIFVSRRELSCVERANQLLASIHRAREEHLASPMFDSHLMRIILMSLPEQRPPWS